MAGILRRALRVLAAGTLITGLAACAEEGSLSGGFELSSLNLPSIELNLFGSDETKRYQVKPEEMPIHVKAALAASVMRLRGEPPARVRDVIGVGGSEAVSPEQGFDYSGFAVKNIELLTYETPEDQPLARRIAGFLHFEDGTLRHAAVDFDITYGLAGESPVIITRAAVAPGFSPAAGASMYVVPAQIVEARVPALTSYIDLYKLVVTAAVPMNQPNAASAASDYVIFVFFQDRLPSGDRVHVGVSDVRDGLESFSGATQYISFKTGWIVAIVPGKFALAGDKAFWVKAVHTPAAGADGDAKPTLVGLFSTKPGVRPAS